MRPATILKPILIGGVMAAQLAACATRELPPPADAVPRLREDRPLTDRAFEFGPGGPDRAPRLPLTFIDEDRDGASPKFRVRDRDGTEWTVKLGPEAQAETVAVRLLWATGYFAEEAYYLARVPVRGLPRLSRGQAFVDGDAVIGARLEPARPGIERGPHWHWDDNPFVGTRDLDGLRVLMLLINNYDARRENSRVLVTRDGAGRRVAWYTVTDPGASFGAYSGMGGARSKNDLAGFTSSRFVTGVRDGEVEFGYRVRPSGWALPLYVLAPWYVAGQLHDERTLRRVPAASARWMGRRLDAVTDRQLGLMFRAAGYPRREADAFVGALRRRVRQLVAVPDAPTDAGSTAPPMALAFR